MDSPSKWFGPGPEPQPEERVWAHHAANHTVGRRAVGGGLHVTSQRVMFLPNRMEARMGGPAQRVEELRAVLTTSPGASRP